MRRRDFIKSICSATVALALVPTLAMGQTTPTKSTRMITLVNKCNFPVFPGATSGGITLTNGNPRPCPCGEGQTCNLTNNQCYWAQLKTTSGTALDGFTLRLTSDGDIGSTAQVTIPILSEGMADTVWTGAIWAGTDVGSAPSRTVATAVTGYCAASEAGKWTIIKCDVATGPQATPLTRAEFALVNSTDFYDISAIHGANIPLSMEPTPGQNPFPRPFSDPNEQYYWCKAPGSVSNPPTAACSWTFAPAKNNGVGMALVQHQSVYTLCGGPSQSCPIGQVCGIAFDSSKGTSGFYQECGTPLSGTWSAIQICTAIGYNISELKTTQVSPQLIESLRDCGTAPTTPTAKLFQCSKPNDVSCYSCRTKHEGCAACCGCPNWPATYKPSGGDQNTANRCEATNQSWLNVSYPWLPYIKQACPAAYSYQFDDVTSTFTCSTEPDPNTKPNTINYTVTFCPDNAVVIVE